MAPDDFAIMPEVADALAAGQGVVALESTIISHGLPSHSSARIAREIEAAVRESGAVPATIAVLGGRVHAGLSDEALEQVATGEDVVKTSVRDLGPVLATGVSGATTVAATAYLAHRCGMRVFATGGLGGVHRDSHETGDESADLSALASTPVTVVCAGVKSILNVPATLERLETLSVALAGYRTDTFPGFYIRDTGLPVPWRLDSPSSVASVMQARSRLGLSQALVVANAISADAEMGRQLHDETLTTGLAALAAAKVRGKDVTPFLLNWFHQHTGGRSLAANVSLVLGNARLAGEIAVAEAGLRIRSASSR